MKKLLTAIAITVSLSSFAPAPWSAFCNGWDAGYCAGWRTVKGEYAMCPLSPLCPVPPMGCTYNDYRCGFTVGVLAGERAARGW